MLRQFLYCLLIISTFSLSCGDDDSGQDPVPASEWNLVFEENFDSDFAQWNVWEGGAFNEEIQRYTGSQMSISSGLLTINAIRQANSGPTNPWDGSTKQFEYLSGRIESKMLFGPSAAEGEREYRFVARIKLPSGYGMWPAFWTYGDPWPTQGEIDILEARGG